MKEEDSIYQALLGAAGLYAYWILYILTGIVCAYYVYQDSLRQERRALGIHPYWWAAFTQTPRWLTCSLCIAALRSARCGKTGTLAFTDQCDA